MKNFRSLEDLLPKIPVHVRSGMYEFTTYFLGTINVNLFSFFFFFVNKEVLISTGLSSSEQR